MILSEGEKINMATIPARHVRYLHTQNGHIKPEYVFILLTIITCSVVCGLVIQGLSHILASVFNSTILRLSLLPSTGIGTIVTLIFTACIYRRAVKLFSTRMTQSPTDKENNNAYYKND